MLNTVELRGKVTRADWCVTAAMKHRQNHTKGSRTTQEFTTAATAATAAAAAAIHHNTLSK